MIKNKGQHGGAVVSLYTHKSFVRGSGGREEVIHGFYSLHVDVLCKILNPKNVRNESQIL